MFLEGRSAWKKCGCHFAIYLWENRSHAGCETQTLHGKLVRSEVRRQPDELDRCVQMVDDLRVGFVHLHELDNEGAVMQNVHQVYAGLTYGKGTLNESIQGVNYEKRGYQV